MYARASSLTLQYSVDDQFTVLEAIARIHSQARCTPRQLHHLYQYINVINLLQDVDTQKCKEKLH